MRDFISCQTCDYMVSWTPLHGAPEFSPTHSSACIRQDSTFLSESPYAEYRMSCQSHGQITHAVDEVCSPSVVIVVSGVRIHHKCADSCAETTLNFSVRRFLLAFLHKGPRLIQHARNAAYLLGLESLKLEISLSCRKTLMFSGSNLSY